MEAAEDTEGHTPTRPLPRKEPLIQTLPSLPRLMQTGHHGNV